jgi:hypothetical protein
MDSTRELIVIASESWTGHRITANTLNCFIDYTKDFDGVQRLKMWNKKRNVGITKHLTVLIRDLHTQ